MTQGSDKLALTRLAIIEHIEHKKEDRRDSREQLQAKARQAVSPRGGLSGRLAGMGDVGRNWWEHHPAHTVLELATPMLSKYASRKPLQFVGMAAVAGALFMFARPWKLISLTGVAVALLKSGALNNLISNAMSAANYPNDAADPESADDE